VKRNVQSFHPRTSSLVTIQMATATEARKDCGIMPCTSAVEASHSLARRGSCRSHIRDTWLLRLVAGWMKQWPRPSVLAREVLAPVDSAPGRFQQSAQPGTNSGCRWWLIGTSAVDAHARVESQGQDDPAYIKLHRGYGQEKLPHACH
jgi:hypothetical protein